jgi:hypothetical protein
MTGPALDERPMVAPAPVSGQSYSMEYAGETRSNYLRGGLGFTSAYDDNVLGGTSGVRPVSDVSYAVAPSIALDLSRSRLEWVMSYSPGFTFYQKTTSRNAADQNLSLNLHYRLSPHVTLSLQDSLEKTSNAFSQSNVGTVSGGAQGANQSVIAPVANLLRNSGNVGLTYQFAANAMVGASGTFSNLHYPNQVQVPGLFDSTSRAGSAFYTHRLSGKHYIGMTYQYQMLLASPSQSHSQNETQTHSILFFYTLYLQRTLSVAFFGGPQHSVTQQPGVPLFRMWSPSAGVSLSWQGPRSSLAASYSRTITDGGGLEGAVQSDGATASMRQQLTRTFSAALGANYAINRVLNPVSSASNGGHTISGNVTVDRSLGPRLNLELGYMRLHQSYSGIPAISSAPNRNRVWVSLSYQFERPLGR